MENPGDSIPYTGLTSEMLISFERPLDDQNPGAHYLISLGIFPTMRGFAPMSRLLSICYREGPPEDFRTLYSELANRFEFNSVHALRMAMQRALDKGLRRANGRFVWHVMGRVWEDPLDVGSFLYAAAMDIHRQYRPRSRSIKK